LTKAAHRMRKQNSRPNPRSLLSQRLPPHPDPRRNPRQRRLPRFRTTLKWCQNPSLSKTATFNNRLFRGRFGSLVTSSSPACQRLSPKSPFPLRDPPALSSVYPTLSHLVTPTVLTYLSLFAIRNFRLTTYYFLHTP